MCNNESCRSNLGILQKMIQVEKNSREAQVIMSYLPINGLKSNKEGVNAPKNHESHLVLESQGEFWM